MSTTSRPILRWGLVAAAITLAFVVGLFVGIRLGQPSFRLSPAGVAEATLGGARLSIAYSRPYVRGRTIFGELVPYGEVWRTGANEATVLSSDRDLVIGDAAVPAGNYSLYTVPRRDGWTLIVNRETGQWGTTYDDERDLARVEMLSERTAEPVEQFTIRFEPADNPGEALLVLEWENTRATVPVRALG